jgi:hypothetical protein
MQMLIQQFVHLFVVPLFITRGRHEEMIAPNAAIVCLNHFTDYVARPVIPRRAHEWRQSAPLA